MAEKKKQTKHALTLVDAVTRKKQLSDENGHSKVHYDVILALRKSEHLHSVYSENEIGYEGISRITFYLHKFEDTDKILIDFHGNVVNVLVNKKEVKYEVENGKIIVSKSYFEETKENVIEVIYYKKYNRSGDALHWFKDPEDGKEYVYTQFEAFECNVAIPSFDQPDLKASWTLNLICPDEWVALSNEYSVKTTLIESEESKPILEVFDYFYNENFCEHLVDSIIGKNYKLTKFGTTPKISTYLFALAAGPYYCYKNKRDFKVPMNVYMRDSLKYCGSPQLFMDITMAGVNFYEKYFETNFPFNKYDQIYVPEYNFGAMENPGLVTYNEVYAWKGTPLFNRECRFCITVLHELAHMWFGNLVTMKWWDDLWLNEAFATFISYLCCSLSKELDPRYINSSWVSFSNDKAMGYNEDSKITTHPVYSEIKDTDESQSNFDMIVYYKGSSLLKQMYYFVGHENFGKGLSNYFSKYAWSNTVFDNFVGMMVESSNNLQNSEIFDSGNDDNKSLCLKALASNWLCKAGLTLISLDMQDNNGTIESFNIIQTPELEQHFYLQTLMIDILFIYDDHSEKQYKRVLVLPNSSTNIKSFEGLKTPTAVILNHNDWAYVKWQLCDKTFDYVSKNYDRLSAIDKMLCIKSIYDKARDGKMSSLKFLEAALVFIENETDSFILQNILNFISASVHYYIPIDKVGKYCEDMFDKVTRKLAVFLKQIEEIKEKISNQKEEDELVLLNKKLVTLEELSRLLLTNSIGFCVNEPTRKIILNMLVNNTIHDVKLPDNILQKEQRFSCLKSIYQSKIISLEEKTELLEIESKNDNYSDLSKRSECACKASLPDLENKKKIWDIIVNNEKESLYTLMSYMSGFIVYDQLDLIEGILEYDFFEAALKFSERNNYHLMRFYFAYCAPRYLAYKEKLQATCEEYVSKTINHDYVKNIKELSDDLKRIKKAQDAC